MARRQEPGEANQIELYRRDGAMRLDRIDWHMSLSIFKELGWQPKYPMGTYANPLGFVPPAEAEAMYRAGKALFTLLEREPWVSASVQMDLGLFYSVTEFVRAGSFVVGHPGAAEEAKADW